MGTDDPRFGSKMTRRHFVLASGVVAFSSLLPKTSEGSPAARRRIPLLQTWGAEDRAEATALAPSRELRFEIVEGPGRVWIEDLQELPGENRVLYRLGFSGLSTSELSTLSLRDGRGEEIDRRRLRGLDTALRSPRIAVMSCSSIAHLKRQAIMWRKTEEVRPDLILFSGDIVYANSKLSSLTREPEKPQRALKRYIQTWESVDLYQLETLIPLLAVWDDHDYGMNNGDSSHPHRAEMQRIYRSFYPLPRDEERLRQGEGLSFRAHLFGLDLYFLDGRSFAEPGRTVWGDAQEAWFAADYSARPHPAWVINGTCFFKYTRWIESVERFARPSLERFRDVLRRAPRPCVLLSGDIHASQVQEIPEEVFGFPTYELTSSAMHSTDARFVHRRGPADGQIFYEGSQNFLCMDARVGTDRMDFSVTCVRPAGNFTLEKRLEIAGAGRGPRIRSATTDSRT